MAKLYYSIGEVATQLNENVTLVRYWTNYFSVLLNPKRGARGNRFYTEEDVQTLQSLHYLIKEVGMTLDGAAAQLQADRKSVENKQNVLSTLRAIRKELEEVRKSL